jgi:hypothetical protein
MNFDRHLVSSGYPRPNRHTPTDIYFHRKLQGTLKQPLLAAIAARCTFSLTIRGDVQLIEAGNVITIT